MKAVIALCAAAPVLLAATTGTEPRRPAPPGSNPVDTTPFNMAQRGEPNSERCRTVPRDVADRDGEAAPARLDRQAATRQDGEAIAAVEVRIEGCAVMVTNQARDLRPVPDLPDGPARLQPAG